MKAALGVLALAMLSSTAFAAPQVTEIRLKDVPFRRSSTANEFVFCSNGNFYWVEGTEQHPVRHSYYIGQEEFPRLVAALKAHRFFTLKSRYDHAVFSDGSTKTVTSDGSTTIMSVKRESQTKVVEDYAGYGPPDLWQLEMIVRGVASRYIGLKHTPGADSTIVPVPPVRATQPAPN